MAKDRPQFLPPSWSAANMGTGTSSTLIRSLPYIDYRLSCAAYASAARTVACPSPSPPSPSPDVCCIPRCGPRWSITRDRACFWAHA